MSNIIIRGRKFILVDESSSTGNTANGVPMSFILSQPSVTSGAIYSSSGKLIKTVWANQSYSTSGSFTRYWDGTDDDDLLVDDGVYRSVVKANNITALWEGVIGNTSKNSTGPTIHRGFLPISSMCFTGTSGFYTLGYNELAPSVARFDTGDNQVKLDIYPVNRGQNTAFSCTDGNYVYWGGDGVTPTESESRFFVVATAVADNTEITFSSGQLIKNYPSGIAINSASIGGMAVGSNFLFVSHYTLNQIHVFNKTTGAQVNTITLSQAGRLFCDSSNNLWAVGGTNIYKFPINNDGSLGSASLTISSVNPQAVSVSPDNSTVIIAEGDPSHVVKGYSATSGSLLWTLGSTGGYNSTPVVSNTRFDLTGSYLAFQPDSSFWIGDSINYRSMHFTANRTFIDYIMFLPAIYNAFVDCTDATKVVANGYLEFTQDFSKTLSPSNGSWALTRNYRKFIPYTPDGLTQSILIGGRRYGLLTQLQTNRTIKFVELSDSGIRDASNSNNSNRFSIDNSQIYPDGSMRQMYSFDTVPLEWRNNSFNSIDINGNPTWDAYTVKAQTPNLRKGFDPGYFGLGGTLRAGEKTTGGIYIVFDAAVPETENDLQYHIGGVREGTSEWLWRTAKNTKKKYNGPYPSDGRFDIGNYPQYSPYGGSVALAIDSFVYWGYHGEFWKAMQCNFWNILDEFGLMLFQFGAQGGGNSPYGMAGNGFSTTITKVGNAHYMFQNDESYHGGIHRWKITGHDTVRDVTKTVNYDTISNGLLAEYYEGTDLNNVFLKGSEVTPTLNLTSQPSSTSSNYSVRWSGFIKPQYSETYTIYANTSKGVRVWINGSLVIDGWTKTTSSELSGTIALQAGKGYLFRMEINGGTANLSWSSTSVTKQIVPSLKLVPSSIKSTSSSTDLLEKLPLDSIVENNLYGWTRSSAESVGNNQWNFRTGFEKYDKFASPDIYIHYARDNNALETDNVTRNLGVNNVGTKWTLEGNIHYQNSFANEGNGGLFFKVLDSTGKEIINFWNGINFIIGSPRSIWLNGTKIHEEPEATALGLLWNKNPIKFEITSSGVTINYGGNYGTAIGPITTGLSDSTANWATPTQLVIQCIGWKYERSINIVDMIFTRDNVVSSLYDVTNSNIIVDGNSYVSPQNGNYEALLEAQPYFSNKGITFTNFGLGGQGIDSMYSDETSQILPALSSTKKNIVIIFEGGNYMFGGATPQQALDMTKAYVTALKNTGKQVKVAVATCIPREQAAVGQTISQYNANLAAFNVLVKAEPSFDCVIKIDEAPQFANYNTGYYNPDHIHPADNIGHQILVNYTEAAIKTLT